MKKKEFKPGKLILLEKLPRTLPKKSWVYKGRFKCFCGKEFIAQLHAVKGGYVKSCGCYRKSIMKKGLKLKHGGSCTRLHGIWCKMIGRCYTRSHDAYPHYGKRGIKVCNEWRNDFSKFQEWALANGYEEHLTIDREDNDGNYEPDNCRWVTMKIQNINQRTPYNKTGCPGVKRTRNDKYQSKININKKSVCLGTFNTPEEASEAYQKARKERDEMYLKEEKL